MNALLHTPLRTHVIALQDKSLATELWVWRHAENTGILLLNCPLIPLRIICLAPTPISPFRWGLPSIKAALWGYCDITDVGMRQATLCDLTNQDLRGQYCPCFWMTRSRWSVLILSLGLHPRKLGQRAGRGCVTFQNQIWYHDFVFGKRQQKNFLIQSIHLLFSSSTNIWVYVLVTLSTRTAIVDKIKFLTPQKLYST